MEPPVKARFIPFEAMTDAGQREHLRDEHGCLSPDVAHENGAAFSCHEWPHAGVTLHTHDKPTPSTS